jgi:hypothetical protein
MANRSTGLSIPSGLGWGASILIVLGLFAHRASQPSVVPHPETREPSKLLGSSQGAASGMKRTDAGVELQATWSAHFRPSSPPQYLRPIAQFLGVSVEELCAGQRHKNSSAAEKTASNDKGAADLAKTSDAYSWANQWGRQLFEYKPSFLIALVPDPDRSRSAYRFDLWVEALQRAANAPDPGQPNSTFVLDHYYLPWKNSGESEVRNPHAAETLPGLLLFRSVANASRPTEKIPAGGSGPRLERDHIRTLVVFLIGEAPVGGIQKGALETSLDIIGWFKQEATKAHDSAYAKSLQAKIVGPVFSGSQLSLQTALQAWWKDHASIRGEPSEWSIDVIGTATALDPQGFTADSILPNGEKFLDPSPPLPNLRLRTTSIQDPLLIEALIHFVETTEHRSKVRIAHLRESNTGFGASEGGFGAGVDFRLHHPRLEVIDIPFPLHISQVHAKHDAALQQDEASLPHFRSFDRRLRMPTTESEGAADTVPEQDQIVTGVYHDISLAAALETLAKHDTPYILVSATDPRDKIFLASVVKTNCPNARLLLTIGDQLYTHSDYVRYLAGAYVASCYPLSPVLIRHGARDHFTQPGELSSGNLRAMQLDSFGENLAFAYHNAVAAHLQKRRALLFYQCWSLEPRSLERTSYDEPPIWLSQVGPDRADVLDEMRASDWLKMSQEVKDGEERPYAGLASMQYLWRPPRAGQSDVQQAPVPEGERVGFVPPAATPWWPVWLWGTIVALLIVLSYGWNLVRDYNGVAKRYDKEESSRTTEGDAARGRHRLRVYLGLHVLSVAAIGGAIGYIAGIVLKPELAGIAEGSSRDALIPTIAAISLFALIIGRELWCWLIRDNWQLVRRPLALFFRDVRDVVRRRKRWALRPVQLAMASSALIAICAFWGGFNQTPGGHDPWSLSRVTNVVGWNSPFVPLFLILMIWLGWCWLQAGRIRLLNDFEFQWDPLETQFGTQFDAKSRRPAKESQTKRRKRMLEKLRHRQAQAPRLGFLKDFHFSHIRSSKRRRRRSPPGSKSIESLRDSKKEPADWIDTKLKDLSNHNDKVFVACSDFDFPFPNSSLWTQNVPPTRWIYKILRNRPLIVGLAITVYGALSAYPLWIAGPDRALTWFIGAGIVGCWLLMTCEMGRIWRIWGALQKLHRTAARLPMQHVFTTLPEYFVQCYGDLVFVERFRYGNSPAIDQQLELALREHEQWGPQLGLTAPPFTLEVMNDKKYSSGDVATKSAGEPSTPHPAGTWIREYCRSVLPDIKKELWSKRAVKDSYECARHAPEASTAADLSRPAVRDRADANGEGRAGLPTATVPPKAAQPAVTTKRGRLNADRALKRVTAPSKAARAAKTRQRRLKVDHSLKRVAHPKQRAARNIVDRPTERTTAAGDAQPATNEAIQRVVEQDERLLGMMFVAYFSQYRLQLKSIALFLAVTPSILLLATASYSFAPQGILMDFTALLGLVCLVVLAIVYSGLNSDEFLSLVSGTTPRWYALSADSITTFLVIILPLIVTLASTLPGGNVVFDWMSSLIRSIPSQS